MFTSFTHLPEEEIGGREHEVGSLKSENRRSLDLYTLGFLAIDELYRQLVNPDREPFLRNINLVRCLRAKADEAEQKTIKAEFLAFCPGAMADMKQTNATPEQKNIRYSGFSQVDIDHIFQFDFSEFFISIVLQLHFNRISTVYPNCISTVFQLYFKPISKTVNYNKFGARKMG